MSRRRAPAIFGLIACVCVIASACSNSGRELRMPAENKGPAIAARQSTGEFTFTSPGLDRDGFLPRRYTEGERPLTPSLAWTGVPQGATRLAIAAELVENNANAVSQSIELLWLVVNVPANLSGLGEGQFPPDAFTGTPWHYASVTDGGIRFRLFALAKPVEPVALDAAGYLALIERSRLAVAEFVVKFPDGG